jgi:hypothetical protein
MINLRLLLLPPVMLSLLVRWGITVVPLVDLLKAVLVQGK